ncbi:MAG: hypothetical protein IH987_01955 [Planctomycetes bacterium]|nr:hypothetical protein [Planctomycetota bacterium]
MLLALVPVWYAVHHKHVKPLEAFAFWGETKTVVGHIEVDDEGRLTEGLFNPYNYLWMPVLCVLAWWCFMMEATGISSIPGLG